MQGRLRDLLFGVSLATVAPCVPALVHEAAAQASVVDDRALRTLVLDAQDGRVETPAQRRAIATALTHAQPEIRVMALRAVARTRRIEFLDTAVEALAHPSIDVRREAAFAVAHVGSGPAEAFPRAEAALRAALSRERDVLVLAALAEEFGRLPFPDETSLDAAAATLRAALVGVSASPSAPAFVEAAVARGAEHVARRAARLNVRPPEVRALLLMLAEFLRVEGAPPTDPVSARTLRLATAGLLALSAPDDPVVELAARHPDAQVRRLAVLSLARRDQVTPEQATGLLMDGSVLVRHAVAARLGARLPAVARVALTDAHVHVRIAAVQALGQASACREACASRLGDETIAWQERAAALVALAQTDRDLAMPHVSRAATTTPWQMRMYAARAAAVTRQTDVLTVLLRDAEVNVRHAALVGWREAALPDLAAVALGSLDTDDGQLMLEAATSLKGAAATPEIVQGVRSALARSTRQRRETSRDPRLALIDRIDELDPQRSDTLRAYLTDFDPVVANRVADLLDARPGTADVAAAPRPLPRASVPTWDAVQQLEATRILLTLSGGRTLAIRLFAREAPTAVARLVAQVRSGEWNGRTFHRVEPGFVIQGGSPAANEYAGAAAFARDEFSPLSHVRGTVGISTRGPDTGDGQIFVNLVDNVRLDYGFTLIGTVTGDHAVLEDVVEGEVIVSAIAQTEPPR